MRKHATALVAAVIALVVVSPAFGHYKPGRHNVYHAVNQAWCGRANVPGDLHGWRNEAACRDAREAMAIIRCEAAQYWTQNIPTQARNGQFLGMFQMGDWARGKYGHGPDPWSQADAAHLYFRSSGWSGWQCTPWGYLRW